MLTNNYLVGAAAVIQNQKGEFLLGTRFGPDGEIIWSLFGGKVESEESLSEGVAREAHEEVNVDVHANRYILLFIREAMATLTQRCLTSYHHVVLTAEEEVFVINKEPHKCFELRWFPFFALPDNIWQEGREAIQRVVSYQRNGFHNSQYVE